MDNMSAFSSWYVPYILLRAVQHLTFGSIFSVILWFLLWSLLSGLKAQQPLLPQQVQKCHLEKKRVRLKGLLVEEVKAPSVTSIIG